MIRHLLLPIILAVGCASSKPPDVFERVAADVHHDFDRGKCGKINRLTDVALSLASINDLISEQEAEYARQCWLEAQMRVVERARERGTCAGMLNLPGHRPVGTEENRRYIVHCWLIEGGPDLDACILVGLVGNATSLGPIEAALKRNPPERMSDGELGLFDTNLACKSAYQELAGIADQEFFSLARSWGKEWAELASTELGKQE